MTKQDPNFQEKVKWGLPLPEGFTRSPPLKSWPTEKCWTCGKWAWYRNRHGGITCNICHPHPKNKNKERSLE